MTAPPLAGLRVGVAGDSGAGRHATWLLRCLGAAVSVRPDGAQGATGVDAIIDVTGSGHHSSADAVVVYDLPTGNAADWSTSGAMALTGRPMGFPVLPPGGAASAARGALLALRLLGALVEERPALPDHRILGERAALMGLARRGPHSVGGAFRVLRTHDGWVGLNLPRADDVELLPALTGGAVESLDRERVPWDELVEWATGTGAVEMVELASELGLAAALPGRRGQRDEQLDARGQPDQVHPFVLDGVVARPARPRWGSAGGRARATWRPIRGARVIDLSSLWAGPLAGHLLQLLGARVVKVETVQRPDGARAAGTFYDVINAGKESVTVDPGTDEGRGQLRCLLEWADVVIESSRPRALMHWGLPARDFLLGPRSRTWVSITAYGRAGPWYNRIGFGDDVALAAGLWAEDEGIVVPCGDAIADPLTGLHAAVAALASCMGGGSRLIDVAMRDVVAASSWGPAWDTGLETDDATVAPPTIPVARRPRGSGAARIGIDTHRVMREVVRT